MEWMILAGGRVSCLVCMRPIWPRWGQSCKAVVLNCRKLASQDFHPLVYYLPHYKFAPTDFCRQGANSVYLYGTPTPRPTNLKDLMVNASPLSSSSFIVVANRYGTNVGAFIHLRPGPLVGNVSIPRSTAHDISISYCSRTFIGWNIINKFLSFTVEEVLFNQKALTMTSCSSLLVHRGKRRDTFVI